MRREGRTLDQEVGRLASLQHGNVARWQLLKIGVSDSAITRRLGKGMLHPRYPGVYAVGHRASSLTADYFAAVLACGRGAVLSGRAAGFLHKLLRRPPSLPQVTTPTERRIPGIETRRSRSLHRTDTTRVKGIPVTTVPRTLVDLAADLTLDGLAAACHEAGVCHGTTPRHVGQCLERVPTTPGVGKLRKVLSGEVRVALSALEKRFLSLLAAEGLPTPATNSLAGGRRVDCRWPAQRLSVELGSYRFHNSRQAWERDRKRERQAYARGDEFRRYTYGDVFEHPRQMLTELTKLLGKRPA